MIIRCWGARGSIPVSGQEYVKYGGDTTCMEIRTKNDGIIIIDTGSGIRNLGKKLLEEKRYNYNIIFTHAHWDHLLGFPFFKPVYVRGTSINMFGCPFAQKSIKKMIEKSMTPPYFPVNYKDVKVEITYGGACRDSLSIDSVFVTPIFLSHPNRGIGYKFVEDDKSFIFLTDNELTFKHPGGLNYRDYVKFCAHADLLIHDAEFTEKEYKKTKKWGHSVYKDALRLAFDAKAKQLGLFHHNQDRTDTAIEEIVQDCKQIIKNHKLNLECFAVFQGMEITL